MKKGKGRPSKKEALAIAKERFRNRLRVQTITGLMGRLDALRAKGAWSNNLILTYRELELEREELLKQERKANDYRCQVNLHTN